MNTIIDQPSIFSLRAAAIIKRNSSVLLSKSDHHAAFYFVGGGIEPNESSDQAIIRECLEETSFRFDIDRLVYVQERFYKADNKQRREITFFYLMKENSFPIPDGMATDRSDEHLHWIDIENFKDIDIAPPFMKSGIKNLPAHLTHIISYE